jgi:hypothetical protein
MALGLNYSSGGDGGSIIPFVKYNSLAGRIFRRDRVQDGGGNYISNDVDITSNFKAVIDMENIEVGYINYPQGAAPQFAMVMLGEPLPHRPGDGFKQGARLMMKLHGSCGGDVRECTSNASAFLKGLDDLHTEYEAQKAANAGKLPIVVLKTTQPIISGQGAKKSTNYQPIFEIAGWAPRPVDLVHVPKGSSEQVASPTAAPASPPSTGSTPVGPPKVAAPQPAIADNDFG